MTWRSARPEDRRIVWLWVVCALAFVVLRPIWIASAAFFPPCLWHRWTGLPCPGCGSTRAVLGLLRGDPAGGFAFNPLAACGAVAFVLGGLAAPLWLAAGGRVPVIASRPRPAWGAAAVALVLANWAWLVASGV